MTREQEELVKVTLVPVEIFGTDVYATAFRMRFHRGLTAIDLRVTSIVVMTMKRFHTGTRRT